MDCVSSSGKGTGRFRGVRAGYLARLARLENRGGKRAWWSGKVRYGMIIPLA